MDTMDEIKQTFFQECEDLLAELENGLLMVNEGYGDSETVNSIFRAVHSIKGGAGAFGLDELVDFAHAFESILDEVRCDRLETTGEVLKVLLQSTDVLADLVQAARVGEKCNTERTQFLVKELNLLASIPSNKETVDTQRPQEAIDENGLDFQPVAIDLDTCTDGDASSLPSKKIFEIAFTPKPSLYSSGNESALILRELSQLGDRKIECDISRIPTLDAIDPEGAYLSWFIKLETDADEPAIREVFEFVEGECDLTINHVTTSPLTEEGVVPEAQIERQEQREVVEGRSPVETENQPTQTNSKVLTAPKADEQPDRRTSGSPATIRVSLERLDRLLNLVGELVINQSMIAQYTLVPGEASGSAVSAKLDEVEQLTREIQDCAMTIRAQPVKSLFQRMSRIVREGAASTGKSVHLITEGEATEIDKIVIERLTDPLMHMIRNAVDHGLETPDKRLEKGKPEQGTIRLSAAHRSGRIVIHVSDDGAGINRERVKQIAIDKGLIPEDAQLTDAQIDSLLFMPGFSTATEISNMSGRGVGMDVVKQAIHALGGRVSLVSRPDHGSTFTINLPLTLAVLDGMVAQVSGQTIVVPLSAIIETLQPKPHDIHGLGSTARVLSIRGEFLPIIDLGHELGYCEDQQDPLKGVVLSVETHEGNRCALLVDSIQDQRQVVIKSLEDNYGSVPGIAAATILGNGCISLILDVDSVVNRRAAA